MLGTPTTIIRSSGAQSAHSSENASVSAWSSSPPSQQEQQTTQAALEQRQLLQNTPLPVATGIIYEGMRRALTQLAETSSLPFVITLQARTRSSVAISVQGDVPHAPFPKEFRGFEVPRLSQSKTTNLMLRPALHPHGSSVMEFDLGAFLFSRGKGLEDTEPDWYAIKRSATHEEIVEWFRSWLTRSPRPK